MSNPQDIAYMNYLLTVMDNLQAAFAYTLPWLGLVVFTFAALALIIPRRKEENLLVYIFKWQYSIAIVYWLNMAFINPPFSLKLFNYSLRASVPDVICKLSPMISNFIFCAAPWMQVMITFDRLWSVYLESKLKINRTKKSITILIAIILGFVLAVSQIHLLYYQQIYEIYGLEFNTSVNQYVFKITTDSTCARINATIGLAQDLIYVIMRIILPFIIMVVCNVVLINYIRNRRKVAISGNKEKREHSFTINVAIMNGIFLACNVPVVIYYIMFYYFQFTAALQTFPLVTYYSIILFGLVASLVSYAFIFSQFFIDMIFNKVFRNEILAAFWFVTSRQHRIFDSNATQTTETT